MDVIIKTLLLFVSRCEHEQAEIKAEMHALAVSSTMPSINAYLPFVVLQWIDLRLTLKQNKFFCVSLTVLKACCELPAHQDRETQVAIFGHAVWNLENQAHGPVGCLHNPVAP